MTTFPSSLQENQKNNGTSPHNKNFLFLDERDQRNNANSIAINAPSISMFGHTFGQEWTSKPDITSTIKYGFGFGTSFEPSNKLVECQTTPPSSPSSPPPPSKDSKKRKLEMTRALTDTSLVFKRNGVNFPRLTELESKLKRTKLEYEKAQKELEQHQEKIRMEATIAKKHDEDIEALKKELDGIQVKFPETWEPQEFNCELKEVLQDSDEGRRVANQIRESAPSLPIVKIERVQNVWLYERYFYERKKMKLKNNGDANEVEAFHGTGVTDPKMIYNCEDGFDMRFSKKGLWGRGIYFAKNARYSIQNGYEHNTDEDLRQIFLAKLLLGDSYHATQREDELRLPPIKVVSKNTKINFDVERHDSVTATHPDEPEPKNIYIIYDNGKAYPAYLITYEPS